mmetsp:Transcript_77042/g.178693  ORF Transcript_77042/g.178693 Transcript_77042/m.178693 type:complete len:205 (-) Transcript_77042:1645-2259(-)
MCSTKKCLSASTVEPPNKRELTSAGVCEHFSVTCAALKKSHSFAAPSITTDSNRKICTLGSELMAMAVTPMRTMTNAVASRMMNVRSIPREALRNSACTRPQLPTLSSRLGHFTSWTQKASTTMGNRPTTCIKLWIKTKSMPLEKAKTAMLTLTLRSTNGTAANTSSAGTMQRATTTVPQMNNKRRLCLNEEKCHASKRCWRLA